ncbi:MAG: hypothetical protein IPJ07_10890 [Acidobacteria bacterium]|nr:hypothetical protein [Acidobacteriota bacterium]
MMMRLLRGPGSPTCAAARLIAYEIQEADNTLCPKGDSHIVVNSQGRARSFPPKYAEFMEAPERQKREMTKDQTK